MLEGLSCNKSCQGTKKTDGALSYCCLSTSFPTAEAAPTLRLALRVGLGAEEEEGVEEGYGTQNASECSGMGCTVWNSWCWGMGKPQMFQGLCQSSPSLNALEDWSIFPLPSRVHLKGSCSEHSEMALPCKPGHRKWGQSGNLLQKSPVTQTTAPLQTNLHTQKFPGQTGA